MNDLRDSAFALREAQRAYMADRGNEAKGKAVAAAAERLDAALAVPVVVGRDAVSELIEAARQVTEAPPLSAVEIAAMARLIRATDAAVTALSAAQPEGGDAVLWCMHMIGPDDVHPAPSREHAQKAADLFNAAFPASTDPNDPVLRAEVAAWPHSAASHAESVGEFIANWMIPRAHLEALTRPAPAQQAVTDANWLAFAEAFCLNLDPPREPAPVRYKYQHTQGAYEAWCKAHGLSPLASTAAKAAEGEK